ncbi:hypothetical protein ACIQ7D_27525 [Streptomyces sp. NPDC096310]|uniref:hypothetical protein n=1 Tax=Streptomyces sp. NPDC096310 TaxID=3366082 RepID=UPI0037F8F945
MEHDVGLAGVVVVQFVKFREDRGVSQTGGVQDLRDRLMPGGVGAVAAFSLVVFGFEVSAVDQCFDVMQDGVGVLHFLVPYAGALHDEVADTGRSHSFDLMFVVDCCRGGVDFIGPVFDGQVPAEGCPRTGGGVAAWSPFHLYEEPFAHNHIGRDQRKPVVRPTEPARPRRQPHPGRPGPYG